MANTIESQKQGGAKAGIEIDFASKRECAFKFICMDVRK